MKILLIHVLSLKKTASGTETMSKDGKLQIKYLQPVLGKVTFKSNALQYCVTP